MAKKLSNQMKTAYKNLLDEVEEICLSEDFDKSFSKYDIAEILFGDKSLNERRRSIHIRIIGLVRKTIWEKYREMFYFVPDRGYKILSGLNNYQDLIIPTANRLDGMIKNVIKRGIEKSNLLERGSKETFNTLLALQESIKDLGLNGDSTPQLEEPKDESTDNENQT